MITGAHAIIYSKDSEADRAFFKEVLGFGHVDAGGGWLIFALPPSEVAFHPGKKDDHELYLMCEDVEAFRAMLEEREIASSPVQDQGWGLLTTITLPGGGELGVYQPRHPRADGATPNGAATKPKRGAAGKPRSAASRAERPVAIKARAAKPSQGKLANAKASAAKAKATSPRSANRTAKSSKKAAKPGRGRG